MDRCTGVQAQDGTEKWFLEIDQVWSSPGVGADGTIYFGNGFIYAVRPDGTEKWRFDAGVNNSSPAIGPDGTIYVGVDRNFSTGGLYAINASSGGLADAPWPKFRHNLKNTGQASDAGGCFMDLALSYGSNTLTMDFEFANLTPVQWHVSMTVWNTTVPLWSQGLPIIAPSVSLSIPLEGFSQIGRVGILTTMVTGRGVTCSDWETIDTGSPTVAPTREEIEGLIRRQLP